MSNKENLDLKKIIDEIVENRSASDLVDEFQEILDSCTDVGELDAWKKVMKGHWPTHGEIQADLSRKDKEYQEEINKKA